MNAEVITENDSMLNAVKGLSPSVNDYKNAIKKAITNTAAVNPDTTPTPNSIDEYFVIFIGKRQDNVNIGPASGGGGSSGNTSNSNPDNAEIYETFCTYKSHQLNKTIDHTTTIVKKDNENPIVLYNRDNKMLKAKSDNIFHLIDTIVSPVLGQQIGDSGMNVAEKIFFKGLPATPPGGNPPVQVTGAGEDGEGGNRAGGDGAGGGPGTDPEENPEATVAAGGERPATVATVAGNGDRGATQDPVTVANPGGNTPEVQRTEEPVQSNTAGTGGGGWGLDNLRFWGGEGGRGEEPDDM